MKLTSTAVHQYSFAGQIIPPDVRVEQFEAKADIDAAGDCPNCIITITFNASRFTGQLTSATAFGNPGTLLNVIEDRAQSFLDILAFKGAIKCNCYVDILHDDSCNINFRIDSSAPEAASVLHEIGFDTSYIWQLLKAPQYQSHLRFALFDARQALLLPQQSGFFCYRAIDTLVRWFAGAKKIKDKSQAWEQFRECYKLNKSEIDKIKSVADPLRHGDYEQAIVMGSVQRIALLKSTWKIIGIFICSEVEQL